jgi:putative DNA primase/helicase
MGAVALSPQSRQAFWRPQLEGMLGFIPADDRVVWLRVGAALKHELGDAGFPLWDAWSQSSAKYCPKAARATWRSFKNTANPCTGRTVAWHARQHGWRAERTQPSVVRPAAVSSPPPAPDNLERYAAALWIAGVDDDVTVMAHPYARAKHLLSAGGARRKRASGSRIGRDADCLLVPCREHGDGRVQGVQAINVDGVKQSFGRFSGGCLLLGNSLDRSAVWYVAEGWATAYSVVFHHGKGCCAVAFGKGNLEPVAEMLTARYGPRKVNILMEVDSE